MVGMMVPSATPMSLLFAAVARRARAQGSPVAPTFVFVTGYVAAWTLFSLAATAAQWGLERAALLSPMLASTSAAFGGVLLAAAGLYQWTPWKDACLAHCRAPALFFAAHWRDGPLGAFRMGAAHGLYCLGCCAVLMGLLFFGGVMNLLWVAGLALFVLLEKVGSARRRRRSARRRRAARARALRSSRRGSRSAPERPSTPNVLSLLRSRARLRRQALRPGGARRR